MEKEFAEWKKQVESNYEVRHPEKKTKKEKDEEPKEGKEKRSYIKKGSDENKARFKNYLKSIFDDKRCFEKFKTARCNYRKASNIEMEVMFLQFVLEQFANGTASIENFSFPEPQDPNAAEFYDGLANSDGIKNHLQDNKYLFLFDGKGVWIDFCSALHKYFGMFNSWDDVNDFCVNYCYSKSRDNFLYIRKLQDLCTYYTIHKNQPAQYVDEIYEIATEKVKKIKDGKNRKDNPENAVTATNRMMQEIGIDSVLKNKESFLNFVLNNAKNFLEEDEEFVHISAIKMLYGIFYPNEFYEDDLVLDNGQYRNYRDYVDKLGEFYLNRIFNRVELESAIKYCKQNENKLKAFLLDKIVPNFTGLQDGVIANAKNLFDIIEVALGDVIRIENEWCQKEAVAKKQGASDLDIALIKDKLGDAEIRRYATYRERSTKSVISRFNVSLRYLSIIAAMWKMEEDSDTYNAEDAVIAINDILKVCSLRYLETNHMCDDFDWFIYKALKYEEKMCEEGKRYNVSGIDALMQYLCEE